MRQSSDCLKIRIKTKSSVKKFSLSKATQKAGHGFALFDTKLFS